MKVRTRTRGRLGSVYNLSPIWDRSRCAGSLKGRLAFLLVSKLYRQMYANTGISTDSARQASARKWARIIARPTRRLFAGRPMPDLQAPTA
jgi:hypothetical protein